MKKLHKTTVTNIRCEWPKKFFETENMFSQYGSLLAWFITLLPIIYVFRSLFDIRTRNEIMTIEIWAHFIGNIGFNQHNVSHRLDLVNNARDIALLKRIFNDAWLTFFLCDKCVSKWVPRDTQNTANFSSLSFFVKWF